jgi:hypothetical protein
MDEKVTRTTKAKPAAEPVVVETPIIDDKQTTAEEAVVEKVEEPIITAEQIIEEPVITKKARAQQNCTQELETSYTTTIDPNLEVISMPSGLTDDVSTIINDLPNINLVDTAKGREWGEVLRDGLEYNTFMETYVPTLEDPKADFRQTVKSESGHLAGVEPKFVSKTNEKLTGERGAIRLMAHLGLGTLFQAPLWHTGIWITFKAPTEADLVEFQRIVASDKIEFGRHTYGLAFSNLMSYTSDRLINFALSHVYDTTLKTDDLSVASLKEIISMQDYPSLLWGLISTMYPRGFQFRRSCISDPEKCNHVSEELLNITKLQWTNNAELTDWQKTHMSARRAGSRDADSVKRYKDELLKIQNRKVELNKGREDEISITLRSPNLSEYIDAGQRWIGDIVKLVDSSLEVEAKDSVRETYITRHGKATSMRQYSQWVESIEFNSNIIEDKETIESTFSILSSDDNVRDEFIQEVTKYINESTISVIGIPAYDCPNCGAPQEKVEGVSTYPKLVNILPLEVVQLFFALLAQKIQRIIAR